MSTQHPVRHILGTKAVDNARPENEDSRCEITEHDLKLHRPLILVIPNSSKENHWYHQSQKLTQQLAQAKGKVERRDATIKKLQAQIQTPPSSAIIDDLQKRLKDLEARHNASKAHESKIHEWEQYTAKIKQERDNLRTEVETKAKTISEGARRANSAAAATRSLSDENKRLKVQLSQLHASRTARSASSSNLLDDYASQLSSVKAELHDTSAKLFAERQTVFHRDAELKSLKYKTIAQLAGVRRDLVKARIERDKRARELAQLQGDKKQIEDQLSEEEGRCEDLEDLMDASARAYALLHMSTVPKSSFDALQYDHLHAKRESAEWRLKAETRESELRAKKEETKELMERCIAVEEERDVLVEALEALREDRAALSEELSRFIGASISHRRGDFSIPPLESLSSTSSAIDLALTHSDLLTSHLTPQITTLASHASSLQTKLDTTTSHLTSSQSSLADLKREHTTLQQAHNSLQGAHEPCAGIKLELEKSELECALNVQSNEGLREEMVVLKMRARENSEGMKRANDSVMRAKAAEQSLVEEVEYLREVYLEASKYEELYNTLQEEHEILIAREEAAIREAEDVVRQNAELAGHTNEVQKISYVEGLRREMVDVKQELAGTRQMLNISYDKINALEAEIAAYKSLDSGLEGLNLGGAGRMKAQRRQQEGDRLTVSRLSKSVAGSRSSRN
ncbi:hypothetical protein IAR50_005284 [Cryptococcus sp. DSM 104548]